MMSLITKSKGECSTTQVYFHEIKGIHREFIPNLWNWGYFFQTKQRQDFGVYIGLIFVG